MVRLEYLNLTVDVDTDTDDTNINSEINYSMVIILEIISILPGAKLWK